MEQNEIEGSSEKSLVALNDQAHDDLDDLSKLPMDMKGKICSYLERKDIWNLSRTNKTNNSAIEHPDFKMASNFKTYERFGKVFTVEFSEEEERRVKQSNLLSSYLKYHQNHNIFASLKIKNITLDELTIILSYCQNVQSLDLSRNRLTALPQEIGRLTQLKELNLSENHLTTLPLEIGQLTQLNILSFSHNQLTTLSKEIGQLMRLKKLDLFYNFLKTLPPEIGQLTQLKKLDLRTNPIIHKFISDLKDKLPNTMIYTYCTCQICRLGDYSRFVDRWLL